MATDGADTAAGTVLGDEDVVNTVPCVECRAEVGTWCVVPSAAGGWKYPATLHPTRARVASLVRAAEQERADLLRSIGEMETRHRNACASWERRLREAVRDAEQERELIAGYVENQRCCGAPSICGATCQDSAEADAIARAAQPIADMIRQASR